MTLLFIAQFSVKNPLTFWIFISVRDIFPRPSPYSFRANQLADATQLFIIV